MKYFVNDLEVSYGVFKGLKLLQELQDQSDKLWDKPGKRREQDRALWLLNEAYDDASKEVQDLWDTLDVPLRFSYTED